MLGEDFRYGHKRSGDIDLLRSMGRQCGFEVQTLPEVVDAHGRRISSSELRTSLAVGNLERSEALLGRPYRLSGHVIHGRKLGRNLGFPTLNMRVPEPCAARSGIYVVRVHGLGPSPLPAVASLGVRPTVTDSGRLLLETHVLDPSKIGRASCRERACQYVWISVVHGSLKKKLSTTELEETQTHQDNNK